MLRDVLDLKENNKTVACTKLQGVIDKMQPRRPSTDLDQDPWDDVDAAGNAFDGDDDDDDLDDDAETGSKVQTPDPEVVQTAAFCRCPLCVVQVIDIDSEDAQHTAVAPTGEDFVLCYCAL